MKKKYRLLERSDFERTLNKGSRVFTKHFVCCWVRDRYILNAKIGIILPKRKCKLAHKRKYLKRLFWSLNEKKYLQVYPRTKCVFFLRDNFYFSFKDKNIDFQALKSEYTYIVEKIKSQV